MAVNKMKKTTHQLESTSAGAAGGASAVLAGLCAAGLLVQMFTQADKTGFAAVVQGAWLLLFAAMAAVSVSLIRGRDWAQQLLLVFWLAVAEGAIVLALASLLWGAPEWWKLFVNAPPTAVIVPLLGLSCAVVAMIARGSAAVSRLRYGTLVIVSVAVSLALVIVVNLLAHKEKVRKDFQAVSRYGISDRTRHILDGLPGKIRLTCAYTIKEGDDVDSRDSKSYHDQVVELLEEIRQYKPDKVEILDALRDEEKALVLKNLGQRTGSKAELHKTLLTDFVQLADKLQDAIAQERQRWKSLDVKTAYLAYWYIPKEMDLTLGDVADRLAQTRQEVEQTLRKPGVVDYTSLVENVTTLLTSLRDDFRKQSEGLDRFGKAAASIQQGGKALQESLDKCAVSLDAMKKILGGASETDANAASGALKQIAAAAKDVSSQIRSTAGLMEQLPGKQNQQILQACPLWNVMVPVQNGARRVDMAGYFRNILAAEFDGDEDSVSVMANLVVAKANPQTQLEILMSLKKQIASFDQQVQQASRRALESLQKLSTVDAPCQEVFKQAADGKLFEGIAKPVGELADRAARLPKLETADLSAKTRENNIIIVEAGGKTDVLSFNDVWPQKLSDARPGNEVAEKYNRRVFNGDSALGSKLLVMTRDKPFATVILTYFQPPMDPQMMQMMQGRVPQGPIPPSQLSELRTRLAQANFEVKEWNLMGEMPAEGDGNDAAASQPASARPPKVLLVVPPAEKMNFGQRNPADEAGGFGPQHVEKIRTAVNSGIPAMFLAMNMPLPPRGMPVDNPMEQLVQYLRQDWGIDVMTNYRLVQGVPDETYPGRFSIDVIGFSWLPLSGFEKHDITSPLQGQRMYWTNVCPIRTLMNVSGVTVSPLLRVPSGMKNLWATADLEDLIAMVTMQQGGLIEPRFGTAEEGKDLRPPLDLAVTATRSDRPERKAAASRIVVLGMGASMADRYVKNAIPELSAKRAISFGDPPKANLDLVVNGVYWLAGIKEYIAAGPAQIAPVSPIDSSLMTVLWVAFVVVMPLLVGAMGIVVLVRRSH